MALCSKADPKERRLKRKLKKWFNNQRSVVLADLRKDYSKGFELIFEIDRWIAELEEFFGPEFEAALAAAGQDIIDLIEGGNFDLTLPNVQAAIGDRLRFSTSKIVRTTDKMIKEVLRQALIDRISIEETADILNEKVFNFSENVRSRIIARTETFYASNLGNFQAMQQGGFANKVWITSRDERVRDTHREMENVVVPVDANFVLPDGKEMPFPQEINERCITLPSQ